MNYSKGICWIDDCRIPFVDEVNFDTIIKQNEKKNININIYKPKIDKKHYKPEGRFPANLLVSDDMLNDGNVIQYNKTRVDNGNYLGGHREVYVGEGEIKNKVKGQFYSDKGSNSRYYDIDIWFNNLINNI